MKKFTASAVRLVALSFGLGLILTMLGCSRSTTTTETQEKAEKRSMGLTPIGVVAEKPKPKLVVVVEGNGVLEPSKHLMERMAQIRKEEPYKFQAAAEAIKIAPANSKISQKAWDRVALGLRIYSTAPADADLEKAAIAWAFLQTDEQEQFVTSPAYCLLPAEGLTQADYKVSDTFEGRARSALTRIGLDDYEPPVKPTSSPAVTATIAD